MRRGRVMMGALYSGLRQMREESPHRKIPLETSQIMEEYLYVKLKNLLKISRYLMMYLFF